MAQAINLMKPAQALIRPKAFAMSMNKEALTGTDLAFSTRGMALAWMLDVPEAGTDYMVSIERICRNGRTSVSATIGRMHGRPQRAPHEGGRVRDDLNEPSLQRYFGGRNAPYPLNDPGNPLKTQQMRPPSERTRRPDCAPRKHSKHPKIAAYVAQFRINALMPL